MLLGVVTEAFNPGTLGTEMGDLCEFKATLIHVVSSRPAREVALDRQANQQQRNTACHVSRHFYLELAIS